MSLHWDDWTCSPSFSPCSLVSSERAEKEAQTPHGCQNTGRAPVPDEPAIGGSSDGEERGGCCSPHGPGLGREEHHGQSRLMGAPEGAMSGLHHRDCLAD